MNVALDLNLVEFTTPDGLTLPGLLYEPKKKKGVIISLHGNGSSSVFYNQTKNQAMAQVFAQNDISVLFFNNRGAHIIKCLTKKKNGREERVSCGMAYEKIKECIFDIDAAISFVKKLGYKEVYLMGASTGANKICVYNYYKRKNSITKNILLCGGDDVGIYYDLLGKKLFYKLQNEARKKIKQGKDAEIIQELLKFDLIFSYRSFLDITNPDGDYNVFPYLEMFDSLRLSKKPYFRHFKSITKPLLVAYGENDEYVWGKINLVEGILRRYKNDFDFKIIPGANHSFHGCHKRLATVVARWLTNRNI